MSYVKKIIKILAALILGLVLLLLVIFWTVWPSKAKLCQDVVDYLPKAECMQSRNALEIVKQAFPAGEVTSSDVRGTLGEYLDHEYPTTYGHIEVYYLSIRPINYILLPMDIYEFAYNENGVLVAFRYYD